MTTETLPQLRGSEKQVAWATSIREAALKRVQASVAQHEQDAPTEDDELLALTRQGARWAESQDHAGWWIANQECSFSPESLMDAAEGYYSEFKATLSNGQYNASSRGY